MKKHLFKGIAALSLIAASSAQASVTEGFYSGNDRWAPNVLIKNVTENGVESSYAVVMWDDAKTALFRIEEVDEATQAWVQIFQSRDYILATDMSQEATYAVQVGKERGSVTLELAPTQLGKSIGCEHTVKVTHQDRGHSWGTFGLAKTEISGSGIKATFRSNGKSGQYLLKGTNGSLDNKSFAVSELTPGIGVARAQVLNAEALDGRSLERPISYVVIAVKKSGVFKYYDEVRLVKMNAGERACVASTAALTN